MTKRVCLAFSVVISACGGTVDDTPPSDATATLDSMGDSGIAVDSYADRSDSKSSEAGIVIGGQCGTVAACGGNLEGTWKLVSSCTHVSPVASCPTSTIESNPTIDSTVQYHSNGTYTLAETVSLFMRVSVPNDCLQAGAASCSTLQAQYASQFSSATCSMNAAGCVCSVSQAPQSTNSTGTYSTSGTSLTRVAQGTSGTFQYCVNGSTLSEVLTTPAANVVLRFAKQQ